jgi:hypothetical protein
LIFPRVVSLYGAVVEYYIVGSKDRLLCVLRPAQEFFTEMETSPLPMKAAKFRPMLGAQDL